MITDFFNGLFSIQALTKTPDGAGSFTEAYNETTQVSGRLRKLRGDEILANERRRIKATHRFYGDAVVVVAQTNRIVFEGVSYDVKFVDPQKDMQGNIRFMQVDLELVQ